MGKKTIVMAAKKAANAIQASSKTSETTETNKSKQLIGGRKIGNDEDAERSWKYLQEIGW